MGKGGTNLTRLNVQDPRIKAIPSIRSLLHIPEDTEAVFY